MASQHHNVSFPCDAGRSRRTVRRLRAYLDPPIISRDLLWRQPVRLEDRGHCSGADLRSGIMHLGQLRAD